MPRGRKRSQIHSAAPQAFLLGDRVVLGSAAPLRVAAVFKFRDANIAVWSYSWDAQTLFAQQPATKLPEIPKP